MRKQLRYNALLHITLVSFHYGGSCSIEPIEDRRYTVRIINDTIDKRNIDFRRVLSCFLKNG
jgi:hypothetical protein